MDNLCILSLFCRVAPYRYLKEGLSQHKEERIQMMQMGLCSRGAMCLEILQFTWEGHGELILGSYFTSQISQILWISKDGMLGTLLAMSKLSMLTNHT